MAGALRKYLVVLYAFLFTLFLVAATTTIIIWLLKHYALEGVLVFGLCAVAAFWGWIICWHMKIKKLTFSHILVIWMVASGTVMGGASYYLAYRGITATLETLSKYIMVETVAGSAGYFIKSGVENAIVKLKTVTRDL